VAGDFEVNNDYEEDESVWPRRWQVCFSSFSPDYDRYLKQAIVTVNAGITTDLSSIFVRDNFYSNIHGGIGILGACTSTTEKWLSGYQYVELYNKH